MASTFKGHREHGLRGAQELDVQLRELGGAMAAKVLRGTLREAMQPVFMLYKARMRIGTRAHRLTATYGRRLVGPGFSRRNTYLGTTVDRDGSRVRASIGPKKEAFYNLWFNETTGYTGGRGTRVDRRARGGKSVRSGRSIPPDPRLVPIFMASRNSMVSSIVSSARKRIAAIARKKGTR